MQVKVVKVNSENEFSELLKELENLIGSIDEEEKSTEEPSEEKKKPEFKIDNVGLCMMAMTILHGMAKEYEPFMCYRGVRRASWPEKHYLRVAKGEHTPDFLMLVREYEKDEVPYTLTNEDLFADDWQVISKV